MPGFGEYEEWRGNHMRKKLCIHSIKFNFVAGMYNIAVHNASTNNIKYINTIRNELYNT